MNSSSRTVLSAVKSAQTARTQLGTGVKSPAKTDFNQIKAQMTPPSSQGWVEVMGDYSGRWDEVNRKAAQALSSVPAHSRRLIELQLLTNRLHAETEIGSRIGEAVTSTIKRLQQSGAN